MINDEYIKETAHAEREPPLAIQLAFSAMIYHWLSVSPPPMGIWSPAGAGLAACISVIDANCATCTAG